MVRRVPVRRRTAVILAVKSLTEPTGGGKATRESDIGNRS
jgi:hypothetical protein